MDGSKGRGMPAGKKKVKTARWKSWKNQTEEKEAVWISQALDKTWLGSSSSAACLYCITCSRNARDAGSSWDASIWFLRRVAKIWKGTGKVQEWVSNCRQLAQKGELRRTRPLTVALTARRENGVKASVERSLTSPQKV